MASAQVQESSNVLQDFQEFMNSASATSSQNAMCRAVGGNVLNLSTGRNCEFILSGGTLNVSQVSKADCRQIANTNLDVEGQVKANINRDIQQYLEQNQSSKQGWLTLALNAQVQGASNKTQLITRIQNSVTAVITQVCSNTVTAYNTASLDLCGIYDNGAVINIGQNSVAGAYQSCTMDVIVKAFQRDTILTQVAQQVNQQQTSEQAGIGSLFRWLIVIAAIVAVVLIIGLIIFAVVGGFGGGGKGGETTDESKELEKIALMSAISGKGEGGGGGGEGALLFKLEEEGALGA